MDAEKLGEVPGVLAHLSETHAHKWLELDHEISFDEDNELKTSINDEAEFSKFACAKCQKIFPSGGLNQAYATYQKHFYQSTPTSPAIIKFLKVNLLFFVKHNQSNDLSLSPMTHYSSFLLFAFLCTYRGF